MLADEKTLKEVKSVLNSYWKYYDEKDLESMMGLFAEDSDSIFIGTDEDEFIQGFDELKRGFKRDFERADSIKVNFGPLTVFKSGSVAWVVGTMQMLMQKQDRKTELNGRLTFILEKNKDKWLITHLHYSVPSAFQEAVQS